MASGGDASESRSVYFSEVRIALIRGATGSGPAVRQVVTLMVDAIRQYGADHCGTYAAAIAYYTLFSVVPLTLVVVSVTGIVIDRTRVVDFIFEAIPLEQSDEVRTDIEEAVQTTSAVSPGVLVVSSAILLWSASGVFGAVRRGLNVATGGPGQSYLRGKVLDVTLVPAIGFAILAGLALLTSVQVALQRAGTGGRSVPDSPAALIASHAIVVLSSFLMLAVLYRFLPFRRPGWSEALWSAGCTALVYEAAKTVAGYAIEHAPYVRDSALYASIGTALALLFWVFVAASVLLFGAEFGRRVVRPRSMTRGSTRAIVE